MMDTKNIDNQSIDEFTVNFDVKSNFLLDLLSQVAFKTSFKIDFLKIFLRKTPQIEVQFLILDILFVCHKWYESSDEIN